MSDKLVYSSDSKVDPKKSENSRKKKSQKYQVGPGPCKVRLEKKGRGGKQVTVLFNMPFAEQEAKMWMKALQEKFACGASFKNSQILLHGDLRDSVVDFFYENKIKCVRAGG